MRTSRGKCSGGFRERLNKYPVCFWEPDGYERYGRQGKAWPVGRVNKRSGNVERMMEEKRGGYEGFGVGEKILRDIWQAVDI